MKKIIYSFLVLCSLGMLQLSQARVTMPSVFSDNMVLQQKTNASVWGTAEKGRKVEVTTSWNKKKLSTQADAEGRWKVKVPTPSFGGPYTISISDGEELSFKNVMIGEVWICSGQSNMEMPLAGWGKIQNYAAEIAAADYPAIRLLQVDHATSNTPMNDAKVSNGGWTECTPATIAAFSSVAYFFAREIYKKTGLPIGLIHTSWGGTIAEAWTSGATLENMADFAAATKKIAQLGGTDMKKIYEEKLNAFTKATFEKDSGYLQGKPVWLASNTADAGWPVMALPTLWESASLPGLDGVVWFRKKVNLPASWAGKDMKLSLGMIDDNDITWVNGEKIGETEGYNKPRNYTIPGNLVKEGDNEIIVRVFDGSGGGGLYDDAKALSLTSATGEQRSLSGPWMYKVGLNLKNIPAKPTEVSGPNRPTVLYNAMIHPFIPYTIRGAIWYQGEANADRAYQYQTLFPAMIKDWRKNWGLGDFPFYFVQLANYMKAADRPGASAWAELREAQLKTLSQPNTGMAVTIDIGEEKDIHPKNKQEVGHRLAVIALAKTYGKNEMYSGPVYQSIKINGNKLLLTFTMMDAAPLNKTGESLTGFEIAGADKKFYWATATLVGNQVTLVSEQVPNPVAARYNWANNPAGNLRNAAGLPASPFRTDNWPGSTYDKR